MRCRCAPASTLVSGYTAMASSTNHAHSHAPQTVVLEVPSPMMDLQSPIGAPLPRLRQDFYTVGHSYELANYTRMKRQDFLVSIDDFVSGYAKNYFSNEVTCRASHYVEVDYMIVERLYPNSSPGMS